MGFWQPNYVVKDTDVLAVFRFQPQMGCPADELAAGIAENLRRRRGQ
jgi:ribulose-bisphosphate carboxylase large chain